MLADLKKASENLRKASAQNPTLSNEVPSSIDKILTSLVLLVFHPYNKAKSKIVFMKRYRALMNSPNQDPTA
jgi:hypothetical protein